ncbi:MAG: flavodoxin family protein [Lachnospiraceae bacterium]|nr:flavodoxin family protein [Lachnospiraceae bacterium]
MKTLILNGSPRENGNTASLIDIIKEKIDGEYRVIDTYRCSISPCVDCRFCWENRGCIIDDEMQEVYDYIQMCDNILIASPIYFSELTGKLLDVGSRLQTYFSSKFFRKEEPIAKSKKGAVVLVGGGDGSISKPYETACILLHHMNCYNIHDVVFSHNTNNRPAIEDRQVHDGINSIIAFFNEV